MLLIVLIIWWKVKGRMVIHSKAVYSKNIKVDPMNIFVDKLFLDGGSNMQLAGQILHAIFLRISVFHGMEHVLSLMFKDINNIKIV